MTFNAILNVCVCVNVCDQSIWYHTWEKSENSNNNSSSNRKVTITNFKTAAQAISKGNSSYRPTNGTNGQSSEFLKCILAVTKNTNSAYLRMCEKNPRIYQYSVASKWTRTLLADYYFFFYCYCCCYFVCFFSITMERRKKLLRL